MRLLFMRCPRTSAALLGLVGAVALVVAACGASSTGRLSTSTPAVSKATEPALAPTPAQAGPVQLTQQPVTPSAVALRISSVGDQLKFDRSRLAVPAGAQVRLRLDNKASSAALQHNWVLVSLGAEDALAAAGIAAGPAKGWVPDGDPRVIAHTALVDGGKSGEVVFSSPPPGRYAFVCTFPGHAPTMRGVLEVTR